MLILVKTRELQPSLTSLFKIIYMKAKIAFIICMMIISSRMFSQDSSKVIIVSPVVGETIDSAEKVTYKIFSYWKKEEFVSAQFIQQANGQLLLVGKMKSGVEKHIGYTKEEFDNVAYSIDGRSNGGGDSLVIVTMKDGNQVIGKLIKEDGKQISVLTKSMGTMTLDKDKINNIDKIREEAMKDGKIWFRNPNSTRYLFGPSAFSLMSGEGYYQNTYVLFSSLNVGITKNISIGGGFEFLSVFSNSGQPIYYLTPKVAFKLTEKIHAGGGLLYINMPGFFSYNNTRQSVGIGYGVFTYGTLDNNVTLGGGYGFINNELSKRPIMTISGMLRVGRRTALVTENWIYPQKIYTNKYNYQDGVIGYKYQPIISYGIRFFGENMSVDLGLLNNKDISEAIVIGIPYIDFVVKFGGK